jgi:hypothetical protein
MLPRRCRLVAALKPHPGTIGTDVNPQPTGRAAEPAAPTQEAVMGHAIPNQHPAVVLRSHYRQLRALLAVAMIVVVGLTAAVVILATNDDRDTSASSTQPLNAATQPAPGQRYDGGPEEGTRGVATARQPGVRYDGGPEEGTLSALTHRPASATFDPNSIKEAPGMRYDGGPEEGTRGPVSLRAPITRYDGGPEEGSRGTGQ